MSLALGETKTLGLSLVNPSNEAIDVRVNAHTAYTNVNEVVEYGKEPEVIDPILVYELGDLMESPDVVTLIPRETREIYLSHTLPDEPFEGQLAGGLRIEEVSEDVEPTDQGGLDIQNHLLM